MSNIASSTGYAVLVPLGAALFRSMGNSKISMQASVIMNIINVIGDSLFIFVFRWGVAGAAAASLISRMTACFILLFRLKNKNLDIFIGGKRNKITIRGLLFMLLLDI